MAERIYQMTRVAAGDYLLPGNDRRQLFRITRRADPPGWDLFRFTGRFPSDGLFNVTEAEDWSDWECIDATSQTREEAIREVVRLSSGVDIEGDES